MSSIKKIESLEAEIRKLAVPVREKRYQDVNPNLDAIAVKFVLRQDEIEDTSWKLVRPPKSNLGTTPTVCQIAMELIGYKIIVTCALSKSLPLLEILVKNYLEWRTLSATQYASQYTSHTSLDGVVFQRLWNCLIDIREAKPSIAKDTIEITIDLLKILNSASDFSTKPDVFFKNVHRTFVLMKDAQLGDEGTIDLIQTLNILDASINGVMINTKMISQSCNYFRVLTGYSQAAFRLKKFANGRAALDLAKSTLLALTPTKPNKDLEPLVNLENLSLELSESSILFTQALLEHKNDSNLLEIEKLLLSAADRFKIIIANGSQWICFQSHGAANDIYFSAGKVANYLREWLDHYTQSIAKSKPNPVTLSDESLKNLLNIYSNYPIFVEYGVLAEKKITSGGIGAVFRRESIPSILSISGLLGVDIATYDTANELFKRSEKMVMELQFWNGLKGLCNHLYTAARSAAQSNNNSSSDSKQHRFALEWMEKSCSLHEILQEKFPQEPKEALTAKLKVLAALRARQGSGPTQNSLAAKLGGPAWIPEEIFPLVDAFVRSRIRKDSSTSSATLSFYNGYKKIPKLDQEKISTLIEFEAHLYLHFRRPLFQQALIEQVLQDNPMESSNIALARILVSKALGLRDKESNWPEQFKCLSRALELFVSHLEHSSQEDCTLKASSIINGLFTISMDVLKASTDKSVARIATEYAYSCGLTALLGLESSSNNDNPNDAEIWQTALASSFEVYSWVLSKMLVLPSGQDVSQLLAQNVSFWHSTDQTCNLLCGLRDLLHLHGEYKYYITCVKVLIKIHATLIPFDEVEKSDRARMYLYAQLGEAFLELGYTNPIASKYFQRAKSDDIGLIESLLQEDPDIFAEDVEWLSRSLKYLNEIGKIGEISFLNLEQYSEAIHTSLNESARVIEMSSKQDVLFTNQFTLASLKASTGRIDEALVDSLAALNLRVPAAIKYIPQEITSALPSKSSPTKASSGVVQPVAVFKKATSWKYLKNLLDSMDQVGTLYQLQGSVEEASYYFKNGMRYAQKHRIPKMAAHFKLKIHQLSLESKHLEPTRLDNNASLPSDLLDPFEQLDYFDESIHGRDLSVANTLVQRGNLNLKKFQLESALHAYSQAEDCILGLIASDYVSNLEKSDQPVNGVDVKAKPAGRGKKSAARTKESNEPTFFTMSPAKIPVTSKNSELFRDYRGLQRVQLRIDMKKGLVQLMEAHLKTSTNPTASLKLLDEAHATFTDVQEKLLSFADSTSLTIDKSLVLLQLAKILIAKIEISDSNKTSPIVLNWTLCENSTTPQVDSDIPTKALAKKTKSTAKTKASKTELNAMEMNPLESAKKLLTSALELSIASGAVPRITSEICQYLTMVLGSQDPGLVASRQNFSIGLTMRHQTLSLLYRQLSSTANPAHSEDDSIISSSQTEQDDLGELESNDEMEVCCETENSSGSSDCTTTGLNDFSKRYIELLEFEDALMDSKQFKKEFVDVLETSEESKDWSVVTISLGVDSSYLLISKLVAGEEPLVLRIDLNEPIDPLVKSTFMGTNKKTSVTLSRSSTSVKDFNISSEDGTSETSSLNDGPKPKRSSSSSSLLQSSTLALLETLQPSSTETKQISSKKTSSRRANSSSAAFKSNSSAKLPSTVEEMSDLLSNLTIPLEEDDVVELEDDNVVELAKTPPLTPSPSLSSLSTPKETEKVFQVFVQEFDAIIKQSNATGEAAEKKQVAAKQWVQERRELDSRLGSWISNFEESILSGMKYMVMGKLADQDLNQALETKIPEMFAKVEKDLKIPVGTINIRHFTAFILACDTMSILDAVEALRTMCGWKGKVQSVAAETALRNVALYLLESFDAIQSPLHSSICTMVPTIKGAILKKFETRNPKFASRQDDFVLDDGTICSQYNRQRRHPLILILDKNLHSFPWESLPILKMSPVTRMPSLIHLRASILQYLQPDSAPSICTHGLDIDKVSYILNPDKSLQSTEKILLPVFQDNKAWIGSVGSEPTSSTFVDILKSQNLLIYSGHGGGEQYLKFEEIRKAKSKDGCAVWLMGCSSLSLTDREEHDPTGLVLAYMISGSPSLVGNLWNVTSGDLDLETMRMVQWLKGLNRDSELSIAQILPLARESCKLEYMNGAALITYGLPCIKSIGSSNSSISFSLSSISPPSSRSSSPVQVEEVIPKVKKSAANKSGQKKTELETSSTPAAPPKRSTRGLSNRN